MDRWTQNDRGSGRLKVTLDRIGSQFFVWFSQHIWMGALQHCTPRKHRARHVAATGLGVSLPRLSMPQLIFRFRRTHNGCW